MIIGISGQAGVGKDTFADALGFTKVALADPMKRFCAMVYGFTEDELWGPSEMRNRPDKRYPRSTKVEYPDTPSGAVWIPLANGKGYSLIDCEDFDRVTAHKWHLSVKPDRNTNYAKGPSEIKLHTFVYGPHEGLLDHVNGNGLDNRKANLRVCSEQQNRANEGKRSTANASSPFKGVSFDRARQRWHAKICVNGKTVNLGRFDSESAAAVAYDTAARREFGPFAKLNENMFLTPRFALQTLGTNWGRACHPDTWIRLAIKTSLALLRPTNGGERPLRYSAPLGAFRGEVHEPSVRGVVIPDIRFGNELAAIRAAGGKVIRITRPAAGLHGAAGVHASEAEQRDVPDTAFDLVIRNTGTVDDLRRQALALIGGA